MRSLSLLTLLAGFSICSTGFAGTITYTVGGTFGSGVATNSLLGHPYSAPNAEWSLTFTVDQNPTPLTFGADFFSVSWTGFSYTLGGSDTGLASSVTEIDFSDVAQFGMFDVIFDSIDDSLGFSGPQLFTGTTASPTMSTGNFADDNSGGALIDGVFLGGTNLQSNNGVTVNGNLDAVGTPEPGTWGMLIGGGLALAALRRRRTA
jgi:hypothetical protein